ncbi:hypothetical protein F2Q69_00012792 [Brassica cretica]|uniref:Uncharacterized protein n=1 Tax=Brassica cretica TaxID=69181 RepID=A0A8S9R2X9_BRACR|nr:hypothetical protein F2Q69_00012792 [Brassica cretica]
MSDGRCRSTEDECLRSIVVSEYWSTRLVSGSTVVLSIDEEHASLQIERSKLARSGENSS